MIILQRYFSAHLMQPLSTFAIIQDQCHEAQGAVARMMRLPRGFTAEQIPDGWHIQPITSNLYYGLRIVENQMSSQGREEISRTS